ncbi:hypothetical protein QWY77_04245 [Thalassotalea ponticola]|uniref:hypothetical protein n=1 Tax=Thalassotalea ponticola TaxID=1523392 RepID=UPI0025B2C25E|nr:hypothetical protein [Thalassotalea ponticola]MDN3651977.1 hypothetical protein [Thalassotalea ponticola]
MRRIILGVGLLFIAGAVILNFFANGLSNGDSEVVTASCSDYSGEKLDRCVCETEKILELLNSDDRKVLVKLSKMYDDPEIRNDHEMVRAVAQRDFDMSSEDFLRYSNRLQNAGRAASQYCRG